jgi:hypothetical protein
MSKHIDLPLLTQRFGHSVAQAVMAARDACRHFTGKDQEPGALKASLREIYQRHVKTLFRGTDDRALEREIGIIYGSLMTHLEATHSLWRSYSSSNNKHVNLAEESETCCRSISAQGIRHTEMFADAIARVERSQEIAREKARIAVLRGKADKLARLLLEHVRKNKIAYEPSSLSGGYTVDEISVASIEGTSIVLHFYWWESGDQCVKPIGELFRKNDQRRPVQILANQVFGTEARFSTDFNTIELDEPEV